MSGSKTFVTHNRRLVQKLKIHVCSQKVRQVSLRWRIFHAKHDAPSAGNLGERPTYDTVQNEFFYSGMPHDVFQVAGNCGIRT